MGALLALVSSAGWSFAVCGERGVQSPQRVAGPLQVVLAAAWLVQLQSEGAGGRRNEGQGHLSGPIAAGRDTGRYNCPASASWAAPRVLEFLFRGTCPARVLCCRPEGEPPLIR